MVRRNLLAKPLQLLSCLKKKKIIPTLTIKGFVIHCTNAITNVVKQRFDWKNALIDAAITSAVTFFSALGGGVIAGINNLNLIESASVAALSQFFIFLALKRGLIQNKEAD
jgi:hypothetical protein